MAASVLSLVVALLLVFKLEAAAEPRPGNYLLSTAHGGLLGAGLSVGGYWYSTGRFRSDTGTLRLALAIVVISTRSSSTVSTTSGIRAGSPRCSG